MKSNISCLHPNIIRNPALLRLLRLYKRYVYPDGIVHYVSDHQLNIWTAFGFGSMFNPHLYGVTKDDIDLYAVIDDTGVYVPMFLLVPCGKCKICRSRKALEWECRCCAESSTSVSVPLFFTLTYDDDHVHSSGLCKRDVQLFLKRLRVNLQNKGYDSSKLRYFIVGEYGHNTHRPHYHGLFWNFPFMVRLIDKIDIVHDSWKNGFTMLSPAKDMSGSYCMKYMKKEPLHLDNKESEFFLCSRGHGSLGAGWLRQNADFYLANPDVTNIRIKSLDGSIHEFPMPLYYRRKLFKTLCQLIPLDIRKCLDGYCLYSTMRNVVAGYCRRSMLKVVSDSSDADSNIFDYFRSYGLCDPCVSYSSTEECFAFLHHDCKKHAMDSDWLLEQFHYYDALCLVRSKVLLDFIRDVPLTYLNECLALSDLHKNFVDKACELCTHLDNDDLLFKIENISQKSLQKEIF